MSIFTKAFNKLGYDSLAARFPGGTQPEGPQWEKSCVQFGSMRYRWCVTIVVAGDGLWVQARPPAQGTQAAIFVPWGEIRDVRPTMLYWRRAVRLTCGGPAAGTVTVWQPVWDAAGPLWEAARAGGAPSTPPDGIAPPDGAAPPAGSPPA
ncbi:MAG TPA: hypothetical protein VMH50_11520 [Thermoleophilia bacterium]|nr:hypothetical protein [Thermoleophilia bacterium]